MHIRSLNTQLAVVVDRNYYFVAAASLCEIKTAMALHWKLTDFLKIASWTLDYIVGLQLQRAQLILHNFASTLNETGSPHGGSCRPFRNYLTPLDSAPPPAKHWCEHVLQMVPRVLKQKTTPPTHTRKKAWRQSCWRPIPNYFPENLLHYVPISLI